PPKSVVKCRGRLRRRRARWSACSRHETPHLTGCRGAEKWPQEVIYENTGTVIFDLGQCCVTLLTSRIMVWGGLSHGSALLGLQPPSNLRAAMGREPLLIVDFHQGLGNWPVILPTQTPSVGIC